MNPSTTGTNEIMEIFEAPQVFKGTFLHRIGFCICSVNPAWKRQERYQVCTLCCGFRWLTTLILH